MEIAGLGEANTKNFGERESGLWSERGLVLTTQNTTGMSLTSCGQKLFCHPFQNGLNATFI